MVNFFADRGFATINGVEVALLKSIKWTVDNKVTRVDAMSRDHASSGFKRGNKTITGSFEFDVRDDQPQIDLSFLYGQAGVNIVAQLGTNSERWSLIDVVQTTQDFTASVGESGKTINFEARDCVNEKGTAVNSIIGF